MRSAEITPEWHVGWIRCQALTATLAAMLASGCGSSLVPKPTRMVADPITLPQGRDSLSLAVASRGRNVETATIDEPSTPGFGWAHGLSDRLTLTNLTWLSYAVIEDLDRETGEGRAPFALAVNGGLLGVGFSSVESFITIPGVGVTAIARHDRLRVAASQTIAFQLSFLRVTPLSVTHIDGLLQIVDRVALGIRASANYHAARLNSLSRLRTTLGLRVAVRPADWVSIYVESTVVRSAEWTEANDPPLTPDAPLPPPDHYVQWRYPVWLGAALHW